LSLTSKVMAPSLAEHVFPKLDAILRVLVIVVYTQVFGPQLTIRGYTHYGCIRKPQKPISGTFQIEILSCTLKVMAQSLEIGPHLEKASAVAMQAKWSNVIVGGLIGQCRYHPQICRP
jgi:hypothetical protein